MIREHIENRLLPGTEFEIQDEKGQTRRAVLSRKATANRPMNKVTKIRIDCSGAVVDHDRKLCQLRFDGLATDSVCVKGAPCDGEIPGWWLYIDRDGTPDPELLIYK